MGMDIVLRTTQGETASEKNTAIFSLLHMVVFFTDSHFSIEILKLELKTQAPKVALVYLLTPD